MSITKRCCHTLEYISVETAEQIFPIHKMSLEIEIIRVARHECERLAFNLPTSGITQSTVKCVRKRSLLFLSAIEFKSNIKCKVVLLIVPSYKIVPGTLSNNS